METTTVGSFISSAMCEELDHWKDYLLECLELGTSSYHWRRPN
jgi:hypothetical protein